MEKNSKYQLAKAKLICDIVEKHYEAGRQDRCKRWVYINHVMKIYPMSERTFFRFLKLGGKMKQNDNRKE